VTAKERWIALAVVAVLAVFAGVRGRGWLTGGGDVVRSAPAPRRLPDGPLTVKLPGGGELDLAKPPGKVLVVHFWATWCPPCVEELPSLLAYANEIRGNPAMELVAVSLDDGFPTVDRWLKERQAEALPIALDVGRAVATRFGTEKVPETYVISPSGEILDYVKGPLDWRSPEWRQRLTLFLKGG